MQRKNNGFYALLLLLIITGTVACKEELTDGFTPIPPEMTLGNTDVMIVAKDTATYEIQIKSNLPWRIKTNNEWIVLKKESGLGDDKAVFHVSKNPTTEERVGEIIAWITEDYKKVITLKQEPGDPLPETSIDYYVKVDGSEANDGLSWENATTLRKAVELAVSNDKIHLAAGTYRPETVVSGGNTADVGDKTFEIKHNIALIGGYPANATAADVPDANNNLVVFNGAQSGGNSYHVITVTAPLEEGRKVSLQGITITGGRAASTGASSLTINGLAGYVRVNGGGAIIGRSEVEFSDCVISGNETNLHTPGVYIFGDARVTFNRCVFRDNKGLNAGGNGGALWNDASTVYIRNSTITRNENTGVGGGIYAYNANKPSKTYIYNTTISNNKGNFRTGFYGREHSQTQMINCTIYGNSTSHATQPGAGIALYAGSTSVLLTMISCTVTNNHSSGGGSADTGSGLRVHDANCVLNIYNTIISGNTVKDGLEGNIHVPNGYAYERNYSIIGAKIYDASGVEDTSLVFDPSSMLDALADNDGPTFTCRLIGDANPARTAGMNEMQLTVLSANMVPTIPLSVIGFDQTGVSRADKTVIGACVK